MHTERQWSFAFNNCLSGHNKIILTAISPDPSDKCKINTVHDNQWLTGIK